MSVCFIFIENIEDDHCVGVKVYQKTATVSEPQHMSFAECHSWQKNYSTIIVLNSQAFGIYRLNLPRLAPAKRYSAIGYALEDKIIHPRETLHIAIQTNKNSETTAVYCEKSLLDNLIFLLAQHTINYDAVTLDWAAVSAGSTLLLPRRALINHAIFTGTLQPDDYINYVAQTKSHEVVYFYKNIPYLSKLPKSQNTSHIQLHHYQWLAEKLAYQNPINLLQNDYKKPDTVAITAKQGKLFTKIYLSWLFGILLTFCLAFSWQGIHKLILKHQYKKVMARNIKDFGGNLTDNSQAWQMLANCIKVFHRLNLHAKQIQYSNKSLYITMPKTATNIYKKLEQKLAALDLVIKIHSKNPMSETWLIRPEM